MAQQPIKGSQIVESGALEPHIKEVKELLGIYEKLDKELIDVASSMKAAAKNYSATKNNDIKKAVADEKALTQAILNQDKIQRSKIQTQKTLISLEKQQSAQARKSKRERELLNNAYKQESRELTQLVNAYQNLAARGRENGKVARGLLKDITRLDTKLKGIDQTVGRSYRNVGNYKSAFGKLGSSLKGIGLQFVALTSIIYGLGRVISSSVRTFADFQQGTANLAAVLGKSRGEIKALTDDAKRLGSSTVFTASQVTKLQVAFSKLGFNEDEILNATEATLALAAATGTDLDEAATVAAGTLNGFGLEADETQRVVDVMAKSFSTSALDMEKFKVAMRAVAPIAKTVGFSIERTTAAIGVLADNGVRAETAGTGLRNILLEVEKRGITFEQAMKKINQSSNKAATSMELFGKENAVVGVVLSENNEALVDMEKGLNNAGGAAQEMADVQLDTLTGATTRLSSAWEGFILTLESGDGVIGKVLRSAIDLTTDLVNMFTYLASSSSQWSDTVLAVSNSAGNKYYTEEIKAFKELQELSDSSLEKISDSDAGARAILKLRKNGIKDLREQQLLFHALSIRQGTERIDQLKQEKDFFGFTPEQTKKDIETQKGAIETAKQELKKTVSQLSDQEISTLLEKNVLQATKYGKTMLSILKQELQRRQDIKGEIIETGEIEGENNKEREKQLTGLAKLQKELTDLEKERSDYLVANNDVIDEEFLKKTEEVKILEERIAILKRTLDERGIGKVKARGAEGIATEETDSQIARDPNAKSAEELLADQKKNADALKGIAQNLTDLTTALVDKRIEALDREAEAQQRIYEQSKEREQQIIAQRAASDASISESLAFEKQAQAQALKEQEKIAKKKARFELINTGLTLLNSEIQQGGNVGTTLSNMTTLIAGLESIVPAFWEGTDTTVGDSLGFKYSSGRDGVLARVDKSEMILNKSKVDTLSRYGVNSTDDIVQRVKMGSMFSAPVSTATERVLNVNNTELISKLDSTNALLKNIASKPSSQFDISQLGNVVSITERVTAGNKNITTTNHKRLGR